MSAETWLKPNRRALALGMTLPALLTAAGLVVVVGAGPTGGGVVLRALGGAAVLLGLLLLFGLLLEIFRPRISYRDGEVRFYLGGGSPTPVPVDVVEAFLLGQGPSLLPGRESARSESKTIVAKLSQSAEAWQRRDVKPALGSWSGGYITIRGTWCEPLSVDVVKRLNRRLAVGRREAGRSGVE